MVKLVIFKLKNGIWDITYISVAFPRLGHHGLSVQKVDGRSSC